MEALARCKQTLMLVYLYFIVYMKILFVIINLGKTFVSSDVLSKHLACSEMYINYTQNVMNLN